MSDRFSEDVIEQLLAQLAEGKGLNLICKAKGMPTARSVYNWMQADDDLAARVRSAREIGFILRAERALEEVRKATDPIKARLVFDAERWYLGRLSQAFADKPIQIGAVVNVGADDAFAAVAGALERAAASISSGSSSTSAVVIEGEARPADAGGRLADLAGTGGPRLGEDADGG